MHASTSPLSRITRPWIVLMLLVAALAGLVTQPSVHAAGPSDSPVASEAPETMCESIADLRLYIGFLKDQSLQEDGLLPILVGSVASLSEARTLAGLVDEMYRPLVDALIASLEDLGTAVRAFREQGTVGAGLVTIGESITVIGTSMDTLSVAMHEPCPVEMPNASESLTPSASPTS